MRVKVKLFSILRDEAGFAEREIKIDEGAILADLLSLLKIKDHERRVKEGLIMVAKNRKYSSIDDQLEDGDEIAFFPPVSGG